MKPGERIRLIQESADSLTTRDWPVAQLTLDQFGFGTFEPREDRDFDQHSYFIQQLKDGSDASIQGVHEYLRGDDAGPALGSGPWSGNLPVNAFLSHIHTERVFVGGVKKVLARLGIDSFVAHDDIQPSQQWRQVIKSALGTCHAFVAFLHPGFHESQWCDQEVGWALGRGIPILTVRPAGAERRDGFLEEHQDVFMSGPQHNEWWVAQQILDTVVIDPRTKTQGVRALAEAFVNSSSYDTTRRLWAMLNAADVIESEQLRRLEYAVQTNDQVYAAVYGKPPRDVSDLVRELVARHEPPAPPAYDEEPF